MPEKSTVCCFTGHRPEKLGEPEHIIKAALAEAVKTAVSDGFSVFISGMARGVDIWAAEVVLSLRDSGSLDQPMSGSLNNAASGAAIRLLCASPYQGFEARWRAEWRERYRRTLAAADWVRFVSPAYDPGCFQRRNEWMVDHAGRVIAVYNGARGGARNTLAYAAERGVPVVRIPARAVGAVGKEAAHV